MIHNRGKTLKQFGVVAVVLLAIYVFLSQDRLAVYGRYIRNTSPEISTNFSALKPSMDETAVRQHFDGVPLTCDGQSPGSNSLGERVCYAAIDKADGHAALTLAAFFNKGKLVRAFIQVPWWAHNSWLQSLMAQWGQPQQAGIVSKFGGPVLRWRMPNGYVECNRDRGFNPLSWSVVIWTAQ